MRATRNTLLATSLLLLTLLFGLGTTAVGQEDTFDVAVFFPGELGGNPIEPPITSGVERVMEDFDVSVRVVEGGNASDWESGITALAATGSYDLIITFTDGMPQILSNVSAIFPEQRFALLDSSAAELENVYSLVYSDEALGFVAGAFAGLVATSEELVEDVSSPSIGLLAGTPYPAMDNKIFPGYRAGAHYVDPEVDVRFAAVGDWNDPSRARDLALNMFGRGTAIIFSITGGGDSGVYRAADESDAYAIAVNTNQNPLQPGVILASVLKRLDNSIHDVVERAIAGRLPYGSVESAGVEEGAISLADDEVYRQHVPESIRVRLEQILADISAGEIDLMGLLQAESVD